MPVSGKRLTRKGSCNRIHSIGAGMHSGVSDSRFFATEGTASGFPSNCSSNCSTQTSAQAFPSVDELSSTFIDDGLGEVPRSDYGLENTSPGNSNQLVLPRDCCLNKGHQDSNSRSRFDAIVIHSFRKSLDASFDKCAIEYYSCGKKAMHSGRLGLQLSRCEQTGSGCATEADNENEVHARSSVGGSHSLQISEFSDVEEPHISSLTCVSLPNVRPEIETSPAAEANEVDDRNCQQACSSNDFSTTPELPFNVRDSAGEGDCANNPFSACDAGFSEQQTEEEESHWESACAPSLSKDHRRTFPPPLNSMAMQSYSDSRGRCTETCGAGYSLRSLRKDGRFVLQEVKAPTHKFFRVSREGGRLKLQLVYPANEISREDYDNGDDEDFERRDEREDAISEGVRSETTGIEYRTCLPSSNEDLHKKDMLFAKEMSPLLGSPSNAGCSKIRACCLQFSEEDLSEDMISAEGNCPRVVSSYSETRASCTQSSQEDSCKEDVVIAEESASLIESPSRAGCSDMRINQRSGVKSSWVHPLVPAF